MVGARPTGPRPSGSCNRPPRWSESLPTAGSSALLKGEGRPRGLRADVLVTRERVLIPPLVYKEGSAMTSSRWSRTVSFAILSLATVALVGCGSPAPPTGSESAGTPTAAGAQGKQSDDRRGRGKQGVREN
jgi:hypothetical protein